MKKLIVVLLLSVLALASLFAGFRIGVEGGYGFDFFKVDQTENLLFWRMDIEGMLQNKGFAVNATVEYDINDSWAVKASGGVMFAGRAVLDLTLSSPMTTETQKSKRTATDNSGIQYNFSIDGKYMANIGKRFSISGLAGFELLYGLLCNQEDFSETTKAKNVNLGIGLNAGVELSYLIINRLRINAGATGAWFFYNTAEAVAAYINGIEVDLSAGSNKSMSFYVRPYAGVSYEF